MPVLHVEAAPADLIERIRRRAAARNQEFSAEVLRLLELALAEEDEARTTHAAALADLRERRWTPPPGSPESVALLREDRERDSGRGEEGIHAFRAARRHLRAHREPANRGLSGGLRDLLHGVHLHR